VFFVASGFATVITVNNPSFETLPATGLPIGCGADCFFSESDSGIPGWEIAPGSVVRTGQFQPGTQDGNLTFFNSLSEGITSAYTNGGTIFQTVLPAVQDGQIYTLTVDLGHRNDIPSFDSSADLLVGGPGGQVFMATGTPPPLGGWSTFTARFVGTDANEGEPITIQLIGSPPQGNFDNVSLTSVPVPEPSSMLLLGSGVLGLAQVIRRKLM